VTFVCWYDTIRFANWMTNQQASGDTETGGYTITGGGANSGTVTIPTAIQRAGWAAAESKDYWLLPTENEWYKAAFHKKDGETANYWNYATSTDTVPYSDKPSAINYPLNSANFYKEQSGTGYNDGYAVTGSISWSPTQNYLTNVGAFPQSVSAYGTLDQNGNVWEWNEDLTGISSRVLRGGSWGSLEGDLPASIRGAGSPTTENQSYGFRVVLIPEPSSLALIACGVLALWGFRRRKTT
jgi:formylglycine-generating enzyme